MIFELRQFAILQRWDTWETKTESTRQLLDSNAMHTIYLLIVALESDEEEHWELTKQVSTKRREDYPKAISKYPTRPISVESQ